jgi:hypothetical protein
MPEDSKHNEEEKAGGEDIIQEGEWLTSAETRG